MAILMAWSKGEPVEVLVDDEDWPWLSQYKWHIDAWGYAVRHRLSGEYDQRVASREVVFDSSLVRGVVN